MKRYRLLTMAFVLFLGLSTPVFADCPDGPMACWGPNPDNPNAQRVYCGNITVGTCLEMVECVPCSISDDGRHQGPNRNCSPYTEGCNSAHPQCCKGKCWASYKSWFQTHRCCDDPNWWPPYNPNWSVRNFIDQIISLTQLSPCEEMLWPAYQAFQKLNNQSATSGCWFGFTIDNPWLINWSYHVCEASGYTATYAMQKISNKIS
mgnify:FL=1